MGERVSTGKEGKDLREEKGERSQGGGISTGKGWERS